MVKRYFVYGTLFCFILCKKDGRAAIHYAAQYSREDVVRTLINRKADVNIIGGVCSF